MDTKEGDYETCTRCHGMVYPGQVMRPVENTFFKNQGQHDDPFDCIESLRQRLDTYNLY